MIEQVVTGCDYVCQWPNGEARMVVVVGAKRGRARVVWNECVDVGQVTPYIAVRKVMPMVETVPAQWLVRVA